MACWPWPVARVVNEPSEVWLACCQPIRLRRWSANNLRRIDEEKATKAREEMIRKKVIYGHSIPYRNMCRFNSGVSHHRGHGSVSFLYCFQ